ncbi:hypothetical protein, partial [Staphylococcus pasteuri]|uniref:hypothetical protein n=1 Tax=Staphylococcus pasteuri TaxID=45972 RepID=UPI001C99F66F
MNPLPQPPLHNQKTHNPIHFYPPTFQNTFNPSIQQIPHSTISTQLSSPHQIPPSYHKQTAQIFVPQTPPQHI